VLRSSGRSAAAAIENGMARLHVLADRRPRGVSTTSVHSNGERPFQPDGGDGCSRMRALALQFRRPTSWFEVALR
jgi:hypothetical protein